MEITMIELALFAWAMVMTALWQEAKSNLKFHRMITAELLSRIAQGKVKVVETGDSFDFKEV
jgi:hypothetical protein